MRNVNTFSSIPSISQVSPTISASASAPPISSFGLHFLPPRAKILATSSPSAPSSPSFDIHQKNVNFNQIKEQISVNDTLK